MFGLTLEEKFKTLVKKRQALLDSQWEWWNRNIKQRDLHKINTEIDQLLDEKLKR